MEVDSAGVETELAERLASLLRVAAWKTDDEESVAVMRAALAQATPGRTGHAGSSHD